MNGIIVVLDVIGLILFAGAGYFAYQNHERLKIASNLWLYFGTASVVAALWIISLVLKEAGIVFAGEVEPTLFFAVIFMFTLVSVSSLFDFIKLQSGFEKKIKK